jgi:hypothetical protein
MCSLPSSWGDDKPGRYGVSAGWQTYHIRYDRLGIGRQIIAGEDEQKV